ncbi:penicillin-binding protein 2 [Candidatus Babeliales bacterium]|nr:penicillin-binding protein 2 [Candidatus Babeliales bacterium]
MLKKDYKFRVVAVFCAFTLLFVVVIIRLFLLQIRQKNFFKHLAQHQYQVDVTINPVRGEFLDRRGRLLAINQEVPSAFVLPHQLKNAAKTKLFLKECYPSVYQRMVQHPQRQFLWVDRKLHDQRLVAFKELTKKYDIDDIQFINEPQRFYPHKELGHVVGFTDIDGRGIAGLELVYDKTLKGASTVVSLSKEARCSQLYFEKTVQQQGYAGSPVMLTLDATLQFLAYQELEATVNRYNAQAGSVLIMDPDTGEILTMANYPAFDPHCPPDSLDITKNSIVTECYELGSVFKIFAGLAALEDGVVEFDEPVDCQGKIAYVNGFRVENWKYKEVLPFHDVITHSSNVGIAKIMQRVGASFYKHLVGFGFGKKTGIAFPGEREGFVNHPKNWSASSLIVMSFGYEIMANLLQLGMAISTIANGGYQVRPTLVQRELSAAEKERKLYRPDSIEKIKQILAAVGKNYQVPGYLVMGKTGTARLVKNGEYSLTNHIYTFSGIIEKDDYRRVIVTFIREPEKAGFWASQISAPLFQKVAEKMVMHERGT